MEATGSHVSDSQRSTVDRKGKGKASQKEESGEANKDELMVSMNTLHMTEDGE